MARPSENYLCAPAAEWLPKIWLGREAITCSLITTDAATLIQPAMRHIGGLEDGIIASTVLVGRNMKWVYYDADNVCFRGVHGPEIGALLVHWGNVPLVVCENMNGMPYFPNGGDIWITWQNSPPYIARVSDVETEGFG